MNRKMTLNKLFAVFVVLLISCTACIPQTSSPDSPITPEPSSAVTSEPTQALNEHFKTVNSLVEADYFVRAALQTPISIAWGPDGNLYIADFIGRRIVKMTRDGNFTELIFTENVFWGDGPRTLAFSPEGILYFNTHNSIYYVDENMTPHSLTAVGGNPLGSIAFSPSGEFYYTNRDAEGGDIRHWKDGAYEYIAKDIPFADNMAFGLDGTMYVSQMNQGKVLKVNMETHEVSLFYSMNIIDPIYMAVDQEGDVWIRGLDFLAQISPDGKEKPYILDGKTIIGTQYVSNITTPASLAFDTSGAIWIPAYTSIITKFTPVDSGIPDPEYRQELFYPGLSLMSIETNSKGELYGVEWLLGRVDKIESGKVIPIGQFGCSGGSALTIDKNDQLFVSGCGKIMTLSGDGIFSDYANLPTEQMDFGYDGNLYAIRGGYSDQKSLVQISSRDQITDLGNTFAGIPLGDGVVRITAWDKGLFLFIEKERKLINLDLQGNSEEIIINSEIGGGIGPAPLISLKSGKIFIIPHGLYEMKILEPNGVITKYAEQIAGDPLDFALSPDENWIYIAESGAVIKMQIK